MLLDHSDLGLGWVWLYSASAGMMGVLKVLPMGTETGVLTELGGILE